MAAFYGEAEEDINIIEGLLCPVCVQDFPSILQLQAHFEEAHNTLDNDVINSIKGIFHKAKKIILKDQDPFESKISQKLKSAFSNQVSIEENNPWHWESSFSSPCRSHYPIFKKIRSARLDSFAAETNKLLIRLDKLITNIPSDQVKRKAHERSIVPWASDKDVPLCPFCAKGFNISRRRHHCRLCGGIMCDECSEFLSSDFADKLASIVHIKNHSTPQYSIVDGKAKSASNSLSNFLGMPTLKRSGSHGSLNSLFSIVDSIGKEPGLRICSHCMKCLVTRNRQLDQKSSKPLLQVYYSKLMDTRRLMDELIPQFVEMCNSLNSGESTFDLNEAQEMRIKIFKLSDSARMAAQKICDLGKAGVSFEENDPPSEDGSPEPAGARQAVLQRRIYSSTCAFLKDNVLALPKVPTPQQFTENKEKKRQEAEARLTSEREAEKRAAMIMRKNRTGEESPRGGVISKASSSSSISPSSSGISTPKKRQTDDFVDSGFWPEAATQNVTETDDPLVQQMNIIRNYIRQARSEGRAEELCSLEKNLKELQSEFKRIHFNPHS